MSGPYDRAGEGHEQDQASRVHCVLRVLFFLDAATARAVLTVLTFDLLVPGVAFLAVVAALRDLSFVFFVSLVSFVVGRAATKAGGVAAPARSAFRFAARSIIVASIAPASPPLAGRCDAHTAGSSSARMSSKSPSLLTLFGANSVMSTSPAHWSRCLISSQVRPPSGLVRAPGNRPPVRTSTHDPLSL